MPKKKTSANAQHPADWVSSSPSVGLPRPAPVISIIDGKLVIPAASDSFPSPFGFQNVTLTEAVHIEKCLNPEFISRLAAKLWDGDDGASVKKAISLVKGCAQGLAFRKSHVSDIELSRLPGSRPHRRNSRFWRQFSLESVIEIAACASQFGRHEDMVKRAFSIIESARAALQRESELSKDDLATKTEAAPLAPGLASGLIQFFKPQWTWREALERITGIKRFNRAEIAFHRFLKDPSVSDRVSLPDNILKRAISGRKKDGFSLGEVRALTAEFKDWHSRWVRSRQREAGSKFGTKNLRRKSL